VLVNDFIARLLELILLLFVEKTQSSISYVARLRTKIQHTYVIRSPGYQDHPFKISIRASQHLTRLTFHLCLLRCLAFPVACPRAYASPDPFPQLLIA
jgi:hypothetical protein